MIHQGKAAHPTAKQGALKKSDTPKISLPPSTVNVGWFRAMRTKEALELIAVNPLAYVLAAIIAHRGRYNESFNRHNLELGEAFLGDHDSYGMSEREYRTAKKQLSKWNFATFRVTNRGTIGKLIDTRLFSIFRLPSDDQDAKQETDRRR